MNTPIFSRTARGYWSVHDSLEAAVAHHKTLAGERRRRTECYKLDEGVWLYVGPRARRRATRHIAYLVTANGATLQGFTIPQPIVALAEVA
ncbi:MAG: hypothetical protein LAO77_23120 [Acidobacteriia bacterium]|nr:hypothetical protein [Terriglobia bacterium]